MTPRLARWRAYTDGLLLVLAIGTLPLLLLELKMSQLPYWDRILLNAANLVVLIAFAVDYFVEFALAGDRRSYVRHEWTSALIVAAQAIALIPGLAGFGALRALRAARVFRLLAIVLRGVALGGAIAREGREVLRRNAVRFALGLAGLTWLMAAVGFTLAEDVGDGRRVHSFGDALWWSLCTITTVGYGDIYPITPIGRLVGGFAMVVGVSTFAVVTARAAQFLIRSDADTG